LTANVPSVETIEEQPPKPPNGKPITRRKWPSFIETTMKRTNWRYEKKNERDTLKILFFVQSRSIELNSRACSEGRLKNIVNLKELVRWLPCG
jgi:hypothetical protein